MGVGRISYQRNSVLVVPFITAWPVQTTTLPLVGSMADTACSRRPSSTFSCFVVFFCGAPNVDWFGPTKLGTVMECPVTSSCGFVGSVGFGRTACTVIRLPVPQRSGHSTSDEVTTNPFLDGSIWMAGTGVQACVPSSFRTLVNFPDLNVVVDGHVVIGSLPCGFVIHRTSDRSACRDVKLG